MIKPLIYVLLYIYLEIATHFIPVRVFLFLALLSIVHIVTPQNKHAKFADLAIRGDKQSSVLLSGRAIDLSNQSAVEPAWSSMNSRLFLLRDLLCRPKVRGSHQPVTCLDRYARRRVCAKIGAHIFDHQSVCVCCGGFSRPDSSLSHTWRARSHF